MLPKNLRVLFELSNSLKMVCKKTITAYLTQFQVFFCAKGQVSFMHTKERNKQCLLLFILHMHLHAQLITNHNIVHDIINYQSYLTHNTSSTTNENVCLKKYGGYNWWVQKFENLNFNYYLFSSAGELFILLCHGWWWRKRWRKSEIMKIAIIPASVSKLSLILNQNV